MIGFIYTVFKWHDYYDAFIKLYCTVNIKDLGKLC